METKTVRCKFKCSRVATATDGAGTQHEAEFHAVYNGSPENQQFFKYTPGGSLKVSVTREQHFEAGKEYYLDITPAE